MHEEDADRSRRFRLMSIKELKGDYCLYLDMAETLRDAAWHLEHYRKYRGNPDYVGELRAAEWRINEVAGLLRGALARVESNG